MKDWYTLAELASELHVGGRTAIRLLAPYRGACHLGRNGRHPRLVLWIPASVVQELCDARRPLKKAS